MPVFVVRDVEGNLFLVKSADEDTARRDFLGSQGADEDDETSVDLFEVPADMEPGRAYPILVQ